MHRQVSTGRSQTTRRSECIVFASRRAAMKVSLPLVYRERIDTESGQDYECGRTAVSFGCQPIASGKARANARERKSGERKTNRHRARVEGSRIPQELDPRTEGLAARESHGSAAGVGGGVERVHRWADRAVREGINGFLRDSSGLVHRIPRLLLQLDDRSSEGLSASVFRRRSPPGFRSRPSPGPTSTAHK
jgi:hypothetical protein